MINYQYSYGFTIMFFLLLCQLVYALYKRSPEAIMLDAALIAGSIMIFADYFDNWILLDL